MKMLRYQKLKNKIKQKCMSVEARKRIDSHRLMREYNKKNEEDLVSVQAVTFTDGSLLMKKKEFKKRMWVHMLVFVVSFVFTIGFSVLSILLWVKPDAYASMVIVGIVSSVVFVASFAWLRVFILHKMTETNKNEEDLGMEHHVSKSIAYAFVALVLAVVIVGFIVNVASADILK